MVDQDVPKYADLLKSHYLFQGFDEADIAHVVARFQRVDIPAGEVIVEEGQRGQQFFLIYSGRVQVTKQEGLRQRQLALLGPGDYFGEDALLFERPRVATVTALESTGLLTLTREDFFELIAQFPHMRMNLSATAESREIAQRQQFTWLGEDEVIYLVVRKHELFLYTSLVIPVILGVLAWPLFAFGLSAQSPFFGGIGLGGGALLVAAAVGLGIWNWIDWGNDYYIVTNQRVVWLERVIFFYDSRREAPLTQVLSVKLSRSWLGRIVNYGNIDVRTFTGGILMTRAANPERFVYFVEGFQVRARQQLEEENQKAMRSAMRERHKVEPVAARYLSPPKKQEKPKPPPTGTGGLREALATFLQVRYEREGVITYRKHWLLLLRRVWLPTLVLLAVLLAALYLLWRGFAAGGGIGANLPIILLLGLVEFPVFLWWGYHYLDWNNDIYQLTPDSILDIERRPLGDEEKKTASLDSILSIEHSREGIIQLLLNYGYVVINVGTTQFIFRGVYNPDQVHQDVADYIEVRRRKKEQDQAVSERRRMVDWFSAYDEESDSTRAIENESDWDLFPG